MNNLVSASAADDVTDETTTTTTTLSGRIQLWQFLFKMLLDASKSCVICWVGCQGEFDILQPDELARMWSEVKGGRAGGNFAHVQRSLRAYYSQGVITKVSGYQYRYKFNFDAKAYLGYSFDELIRLLDKQKR